MSTLFNCQNIFVSSYSVQSNSSNSDNSVQYKYSSISNNSFCLHTVKCQNCSILNNSVLCKQSSNVKTVPFQTFSLAKAHSLNVSTQFNCQKHFLFQTILSSHFNYSVQQKHAVLIQFSIRNQLVLFNTQIGPYQVLALGKTWEQQHSPKLQHHWKLTLRLFSVISRTLIGGGLTPLQRYSRCILQPQPTVQTN